MRRKFARGCGVALGVWLAAAAGAAEIGLPRGQLLRQRDAWYAGPEAHGLADNIVAQQAPVGGWTNWTNEGGMLKTATPAEIAKQDHGSIDDGATTTQLRILARIVTAAAGAPAGSAPAGRVAAWRAAAERGLDFLFAAQYPNGGWPQHHPGKGYRTNITFNDDAMANVILLLQDVGAAEQPQFAWVDADRKARARAAVAKGLECILKCQVVVDGKKTAWGAQHDPKTLQPAAARAFEPVALTGAETVGLVRLLMAIERPGAEVVAAIEAAVAWLEAVKLTGIRFERIATPEGKDGRVVRDPAAGPIWARFYEIGTNRPIFVGRDAVIRYDVAEIERERRGGYGWYNDRARDLLAKDYPRWKAKGGR
jgi:PelA/Pel-15E family pectate lyase